MQIEAKKIRKSYGFQDVLLDVTVSLSYGERSGLVGANGSGKSTLLSILAGQEEPDGGTLLLDPGLCCLLPQNPAVDKEPLSGEARKYCKLLGMDPDTNRAEDTLSGGERSKLALCRLLAQNPKILLLDEPTNNLDFQGIQALLSLLAAFEGTIVAVSHDRYFLDALADTIIELENGVSIEYAGGYTCYREEKRRRFEENLHRYEEGVKEQRRVEQAIRQMSGWSEKAHRESTKKSNGQTKMGLKEYHRAKAKKMDTAVKSRKKRLEKLVQATGTRPQEEKGVYFQLQSEGSHGKRILEAEGLSKAFGNHILFSNSDFTVARGEKVALFGPNGCGKTTFLRMLQGMEAATGGNLWVSPTLQYYMLPQTFSAFPKNKTVLEYLAEKLGRLTGENRTALNNMGLTARHLNQKIQTLSFGEQMKLKLAEPILEGSGFLILDEPTNHLDLHAREMLEETLCAYNGTLLLVSHDIYFLKAVCNKVLLFEGGTIRRLECSFADYLKRQAEF